MNDTEKPHRIIIAGTRTFTDYAFLARKMERLVQNLDLNAVEVVSGGARGADALGERWASGHGLPFKRFRAQWDRHGRRAGPLRNRRMAEYATHLVAFWNGKSRGTKNMIEEAKQRGLQIRIVRIDKQARKDEVASSER